MAFPLPDHLPRRAVPQDISSRILGRIDEATLQTLNAELARSWLADLDDNITSIKVCLASLFFSSTYFLQHRIRDTIHSNLPRFESQLAASKSVRERLQTLEADVDALHETVSHSQVRSQSHQYTTHSHFRRQVWSQQLHDDSQGMAH